MDSPERGALMLVRIIAVALIGWAVADMALYWVVCNHNNQSIEVLKMVLKSLPLLAGIICLIKSKALAEWVSSFLDN